MFPQSSSLSQFAILGETSRIPLVRKAISGCVGKKPCADLEEAVVAGAVFYAGDLAAKFASEPRRPERTPPQKTVTGSVRLNSPSSGSSLEPPDAWPADPQANRSDPLHLYQALEVEVTQPGLLETEAVRDAGHTDCCPPPATLRSWTSQSDVRRWTKA
jgi:hypothetical protein